jgi:hypothetical protein
VQARIRKATRKMRQTTPVQAPQSRAKAPRNATIAAAPDRR